MRTADLGSRVGPRLRARREELGWSQAKLAEAAGITPNYVGVLERGEKLPTLEMLEALADALGMSSAALLAEDERNADSWLDRVVSAARAIAPQYRPLVLAFLRAAASQRSRQPRGKPRPRK